MKHRLSFGGTGDDYYCFHSRWKITFSLVHFERLDTYKWELRSKRRGLYYSSRRALGVC